MLGMGYRKRKKKGHTTKKFILHKRCNIYNTCASCASPTVVTPKIALNLKESMLPVNINIVKSHVKETISSGDKSIAYPFTVDEKIFFDAPGLDADTIRKVIRCLIETGEVKVNDSSDQRIDLLPPFGNDETSGAE
jgi:hypothetical protein